MRRGEDDQTWMRLALRLARRAAGKTSPNPLVGAVLVRNGGMLGRGWHHRAGEPHAEIEAVRDAERIGHSPRGATLYVTLEPCCTHGRTPPCTDAIVTAGICEVVVGATDPNPRHAGRGFKVLRRAGVRVVSGVLEAECHELNESFNHWIVHKTPWVTVKAAMTLDGKIATAGGDSKWITGPQARGWGMRLRRNVDAILTGINTILADDPSLTARDARGRVTHPLRRIVLDSTARTPLTARVMSDEQRTLTTIVVGPAAPARWVAALGARVRVLRAPAGPGGLNLKWLLRKLGAENVTSLLVEGGGEVNASFLLGGLAHRVAFFYAPKVLGGRDARPGVGGAGVATVAQALGLSDVRWQRLGPDLLLTART
jgi:diaminohydroxyphosphoribosylaminopyrimidine deaminase/5-amino-6-(5-phosphoribosylamino)uracil reductase